MGEVRRLGEARSTPSPRDQGNRRRLISQGRWHEARASLDELGWLSAADLEIRGTLAFLLGDTRAYFEDMAAAHQSYDDPASAARCAAWISIMHLIRGEAGHSAGWMATARRLVDQHGECAASAYLEVLPILADESPNRDQAISTARQVHEIARRHNDSDATALTGQTLGHLLIRTGRADEGRQLTDEAMVAASTGRLSSPLVEILAYLAVMAGCRLSADLTRAREWTAGIRRRQSQWPQLVAFSGVLALCRAELAYLSGDWPAALDDLDAIDDRPLLGESLHLRGEILRRTGRYDEAREAYTAAASRGRDCTAGLTELRLATGEADAARTIVLRALAVQHDACDRATLLPAAVAALAPASPADAAVLAAELTTIAARLGSPLLTARAQHAAGLVALHHGDADEAIRQLWRACTGFAELGVPAELAASHASSAAAHRLNGDAALAQAEQATAERLSARIGMPAPPGPRPIHQASASGPARLSTRERDVLRRVAGGATNREIAAALTLSPRTVDRHVSNILAKLELTSRAAAAAFAAENGLI